MQNFLEGISVKRKFLLLVCLFLSMDVFFSILYYALGSGLNTPVANKLAQDLYSIGKFLLPAFLAARLFSKERPASYLGFRRQVSIGDLLLSVLAILSCMVVMDWLGRVNHAIPFFDRFKAGEATMLKHVGDMMVMSSYGDLVFNLFVFAIIPSICEEVFFRGAMQPLLIKWTGSAMAGILITGFLFSLLHYELMGLLPRFAAGFVLGYVFYYTNNLWMSIAAHILNNGISVLFYYINGQAHKPVIDENLHLPVYATVGGILVCTGTLLLLRRKRSV